MRMMGEYSLDVCILPNYWLAEQILSEFGLVAYRLDRLDELNKKLKELSKLEMDIVQVSEVKKVRKNGALLDTNDMYVTRLSGMLVIVWFDE